VAGIAGAGVDSASRGGASSEGGTGSGVTVVAGARVDSATVAGSTERGAGSTGRGAGGFGDGSYGSLRKGCPDGWPEERWAVGRLEDARLAARVAGAAATRAGCSAAGDLRFRSTCACLVGATACSAGVAGGRSPAAVCWWTITVAVPSVAASVIGTATLAPALDTVTRRATAGSRRSTNNGVKTMPMADPSDPRFQMLCRARCSVDVTVGTVVPSSRAISS
jgi:hypothetical protein